MSSLLYEFIRVSIFNFIKPPINNTKINLLVFDLGSLGPSTVTLIAFPYVVTMGGLVDTVIVNVKLLPAEITERGRKSVVDTR